MQEGSCRGQSQHQKDRCVVAFTRCRDHHGFRHEAAEERHCGDGEAPDHVETEGDRHGLVETAHVTELA